MYGKMETKYVFIEFSLPLTALSNKYLKISVSIKKKHYLFLLWTQNMSNYRNLGIMFSSSEAVNTYSYFMRLNPTTVAKHQSR